MSYLLDEEKLKPLFEAKERISQKFSKDNKFTKPYAKHLNLIVKEVLRQASPVLHTFPYIWQSSFWIDKSEAESLVYTGLLKAVQEYNIYAGKCKFSSFLWTVIGQQFKNYETYMSLDKHKAHFMSSSLDRIVEDNEPLIELSDKTPVIIDDYVDCIKYLKEHLYGKEKQVVILLEAGKSLAYIAKQLKIKKSSLRVYLSYFHKHWKKILCLS